MRSKLGGNRGGGSRGGPDIKVFWGSGQGFLGKFLGGPQEFGPGPGPPPCPTKFRPYCSGLPPKQQLGQFGHQSQPIPPRLATSGCLQVPIIPIPPRFAKVNSISTPKSAYTAQVGHWWPPSSANLFPYRAGLPKHDPTSTPTYAYTAQVGQNRWPSPLP